MFKRHNVFIRSTLITVSNWPYTSWHDIVVGMKMVAAWRSVVRRLGSAEIPLPHSHWLHKWSMVVVGRYWSTHQWSDGIEYHYCRRVRNVDAMYDDAWVQCCRVSHNFHSANLVDPVVTTNLLRYRYQFRAIVVRPLVNREIAAVVVVDSVEHQTDRTECEYHHLPLLLLLHSHVWFGFAPAIVKYRSHPWSSHVGFENPVTSLAKFCVSPQFLIDRHCGVGKHITYDHSKERRVRFQLDASSTTEMLDSSDESANGSGGQWRFRSIN